MKVRCQSGKREVWSTLETKAGKDPVLSYCFFFALFQQVVRKFRLQIHLCLFSFTWSLRRICALWLSCVCVCVHLTPGFSFLISFFKIGGFTYEDEKSLPRGRSLLQKPVSPRCEQSKRSYTSNTSFM